MSTPVLLLDMMDTLVVDPFWNAIPDVFGMDREALFARKTPGVWEAFEQGAIDEQTFRDAYFADGEPLDVDRIKRVLRDGYAWIDGAEALLADLRAAGVPMHVFSNYPYWYEYIEAKLDVSRFLPWTFVSWNTGTRKPEPAAYLDALGTLDLPPSACVLVDDRVRNCEGALGVGMDAVRFTGIDALRAALVGRGIPIPGSS